MNKLNKPADYTLTKIVNRIFYINVANLAPSDIKNYLEEAKRNFLGNDEDIMCYNNDAYRTSTLWENIFVPVRVGDTRIEFMVIDL